MSKENNKLSVAGFPRDQVELIKNTVARGATDDELALFLYQCNRTGLDPLTKQIHFVKRRVWNSKTNGFDEVATIQTGIDGFRSVAVRSKELGGIDDGVFDSEDKNNPQKCSVTVYRLIHGERIAFTATARWKEYAQTDKEGNAVASWKKMPYLMLCKCAEALALRKAFPNDLSGLYTADEMTQADTGGIRIVNSEYDQSPIDDDVPVISTGDDLEGPKEKEIPEDEVGQKQLIMALIAKKIPGIDLKSAKAIKTAVADETQMELVPANFVAIIKELR